MKKLLRVSVLLVLVVFGIGLAGCRGPLEQLDVSGANRAAAAKGIWNGESDKAVAVSIEATESARTNASGIKIASNAQSADLPGIYFIWDYKQKDSGYLKVSASVFDIYESFTLTAKEANKYWDFNIELQFAQEQTVDGYYVFYIPKSENNKNINMVFFGNYEEQPVVPPPEDLTPGVHVNADNSSPTGYTVTFIYKESTHEDLLAVNPVPRVRPGTVTKVQLYSETMFLFNPNTPSALTASGTINNAYSLNSASSSSMKIQPENFVPGLVNGGGSSTHGLTRDLARIEGTEDLWYISLPLPSGAFEYRYIISSALGNNVSRLNDPYNPTMVNTATGLRSISSMVYVPYKAAKQGYGPWADRSFTYPRNDQKGTIEFAKYEVRYGVANGFGGTGNFSSTSTSKLGNYRGLAIYLPYGYNPNRAEPYSVLYISMGASGDAIGNEMRWMHEGAGPQILDNLIADGSVEPFILVSGNWQDLSSYSFNLVRHDMYQYIIPYMEANYNVRTDRDGRAFAGLSMGGQLTSNFYLSSSDMFKYFGIFSMSATSAPSNAQPSSLYLGAGYWDYTMNTLYTFRNNLNTRSIPYFYETVPGGHDWVTWQTLLYKFAKFHLWK